VDQFKRVVELAGSYHEEAARCADAGAFYAACIMIGCALEAALLATAAIFENDLRQQDRWPTGKPLEKWDLSELTALARREGWLPALGSGEPRDLNESEVGDAVEFVRWLRNLAAHPGRHIRDAAQVHLGEVAYRNAYGVVAAAFNETYEVIQSLD
jgi:hypothetical protein